MTLQSNSGARQDVKMGRTPRTTPCIRWRLPGAPPVQNNRALPCGPQWFPLRLARDEGVLLRNLSTFTLEYVPLDRQRMRSDVGRWCSSSVMCAA